MTSAPTFPKEARLRRKGEFALVLARGDVFPGKECLVRRLRNDLDRPRLGLATPRGFGSAVKRNRFRRLVREVFRANREGLTSYDYLVSPRRGLERPTIEGIREDLLRTRTATAAPPRRPRERP